VLRGRSREGRDMPGTMNADVVGELKDVLDELVARINNYAEAAVESEEANDAGLALLAKVQTILQRTSVALWKPEAKLKDQAVERE
jgi:hypothetical protein